MIQQFATILQLAEIYADIYNKQELCLSSEQNEAYFRDFVNQYYSNLRWGINQSIVINTDIPLF
jgi:hypothetical protein